MKQSPKKLGGCDWPRMAGLAPNNILIAPEKNCRDLRTWFGWQNPRHRSFRTSPRDHAKSIIAAGSLANHACRRLTPQRRCRPIVSDATRPTLRKAIRVITLAASSKRTPRQHRHVALGSRDAIRAGASLVLSVNSSNVPGRRGWVARSSRPRTSRRSQLARRDDRVSSSGAMACHVGSIRFLNRSDRVAARSLPFFCVMPDIISVFSLFLL